MDIIEVNAENQSRHPWELARYQALYPFINQLLKTQGEKWILDIGAGDAYFAQRLLAECNNIKIVAVDPCFPVDKNAELTSAMENGRLFLFNDLKEAEKMLEGKGIDVVLLLDVIEHIKDDEEFMTSLGNSSIYHEAFFLITVPSFQKLYTQHDKFLRHERRYNIETLKKLLANSGFQPIKTGYFFTSLLLVRVVQKILEKSGLSIQQKGVGNWRGGKKMTRLLTSCLVADFRVSEFLNKLGIKLPGLSTYCICKKPV